MGPWGQGILEFTFSGYLLLHSAGPVLAHYMYARALLARGPAQEATGWGVRRVLQALEAATLHWPCRMAHAPHTGIKPTISCWY